MPVSAEQMLVWCRTLLGVQAEPVEPSLKACLDSIPRLRSLDDLPRGTPILVRGDLDAKPGATVGEGDVRLRSMRETLAFGRRHGFKQVLVGHIGRKPEETLKKVAARLGQIMECDVPLIGDWLDESTVTIADHVRKTIRDSQPGSILMLENARRYNIERVLWDATADDVPKLAEPLARIANEFAEKVASTYINEALSAGSLDASSTVVPAAMDRVALGAYVAQEFEGPLMRCLAAQLVIFSGLKTDKLDDLEAIVARGKVEVVFAAGSLAMALKKAAAELDGQQLSIGAAEDAANSKKPFYVSRERIEQAKRLIRDGRQKKIEFVLPIDFVLQDGQASETIGPGDQQFDVGPKTRELFARKIGDFIAAHRGRPAAAFYNGVFGMFEDPRFEQGTRDFIHQLKRLKDAGVKVYVGGGEGGTALERYGKPDWVTHTFTAGGTVLNALGSESVPYLTALSMASESRGRRTARAV